MLHYTTLTCFYKYLLLITNIRKNMKYRAKHLRWNGKHWTCILERWEGCECTTESKKVEIHQVKRPSLKEIKDCAGWSQPRIQV